MDILCDWQAFCDCVCIYANYIYCHVGRNLVISLITDSPMYAVINNFMGSGSVTYECEGHETRLSDCMSPMSSPCYYALVKCSFTTDMKSGESTISGLSAGIVAGVVSLLAVLLVVTIVILILWLKRRAKNLKAGGDNANSTSPQALPTTVIADVEKTCLHDNPSYQYTTAFISGTDAGNIILLQENPSYQPITVVSGGTKI